MKRILSIDGGGIKGALPAAFLASVEEQTGRRIVDHFDLIVGTSTGGIIALGLGLGIPAAEILRFYIERGPDIFGGAGSGVPAHLKRLGRWTRWLVRPKYQPHGLRAALEDVLGGRRLGESATRLVIPAYHPDRRGVYVFKTAHHPRFSYDFRQSAVDVAMSTAAAPTYFPAHSIAQGANLIDGGVWANNPIGVAAVEAVGVLGWQGADLRILSLGCTDEVFAVPANGGRGQLATLALDLMFQGQSFSALGIARLLTGDPHEGQRIFRYDPIVPRGTFILDDATQARRLAGIGEAEARERMPAMREVFMTEPREAFRPSYELDASAAA